MEADGFEFVVPAELKGHVDMKNGDIEGWIDLMAAVGRTTASPSSSRPVARAR